MEHRIVKIEKDITILTSAVDEIKTSIGKIDDSLKALIALQTDTKLLEQQLHNIKESNDDAHKRLHERINGLESTVIWVNRVIVGSLITGGIGVLFFVLRKVI